MSNVVDIHSHIYPEPYVEFLAARDVEPLVREEDGRRMFVIFPGEAGRPMDATYWDIGKKLEYMDRSGIDRTVLSLGNPWLDPINGPEGIALARDLNDYFAALAKDTGGRIHGMGCLPSTSVPEAVDTVDAIAARPELHGVVIGSRICGLPLDDPALEPLWQAFNDTHVPVMLHPHYGLGLEHMEGYGHVLPLALSFTFETTTALARMALAGIFSRMPDLSLVGSHGGGALPFLAGRLDGCWRPDEVAQAISSSLPSDEMSRLYLDALVYHPRSLRTVADLVGTERMAFGTDHPFAISDPAENLRAIRSTFDGPAAEDVLNGTATRLFRL
jgi:predicted TIM-barrel fold metal-dependent hydrolase